MHPGHPGGQALLEKIIREEKISKEEQERVRTREEENQRKEKLRSQKEQIKLHLKQAEGQIKGKQFDRAKEEIGKALEIEGDHTEVEKLLARLNKVQEDVKMKDEARARATDEAEAKRKAEEATKVKEEADARIKAEEKSKQEAEEARQRAQEKIRKETSQEDQKQKKGLLLSKFSKEKKLESTVTPGGEQLNIQEKEATKKTGAKPMLNLSALYKGKERLKKIDLKNIDLKKIKKNYIWILLGILIVTFALAHTIGKLKQVFFKGPKEDQKTSQFADTVPVKVYKVKRMDFKDTLPVLGRIEGFKEIELRFHESGILESFNFEEGERILEGDIIASLDQKDALLKLKYASLEMEKTQRLLEIGGVDKMASDQKKLEYESAKRDLEKTNTYAPSDGYLGSKEKQTGGLVTPQEKIGTFVDFSEVYATFDVIEEDSPKVELGQNAEIFLDAYPGASYTGTVDMKSPMVEGRTRTQKIKIELTNEEDELRPGMFARAILNTYEKKDALIIPASSFKKVENKYFVYIVHPDEEEVEGLVEEGGLVEDADLAGSQTGTVEEREIKIEYLTHDVAEVGEGLKEGELVIRELHQEYKDQDKVEITEIQETIF